MLSTQYRLRLEGICNKIVNGETVELSDMIWSEKLAKANRHAATILRQARRKAENPDMVEDSLDGFLNALDIGGLGNERQGISGFDSVDEIVDWFRRDDLDSEGDNDWRRRD
jgi:hypothetical protein